MGRNPRRQLTGVVKIQLLAFQAVVLTACAVIVLWLAVGISDASADNGEFDARTGQSRLYLP